MVEMRVMGLALDEGSRAPILLLSAPGTNRLLPIWIGANEAIAISLALNSIPMPRPLTHDLLLNCVHALGGAVERVDLVSLEEGTFIAELALLRGGQILKLDSRPSDAVALALRAKKPIFVSPEVLDAAGLDRQQTLDSTPAQIYGPEEASNLLAALFSVSDSSNSGEAKKSGQEQENSQAQPQPRVTITVTPMERKLENSGAPASSGPLTVDSPQSRKNLEELLRRLDPETKHRM